MEPNDPVATALGNLIRATAEDQGMPLGELAKKSGVHRVSLYRYLEGDRDMQLSVLTAIAGALRVEPHALLHDAIERAGWDSRSA